MAEPKNCEIHQGFQWNLKYLLFIRDSFYIDKIQVVTRKHGEVKN